MAAWNFETHKSRPLSLSLHCFHVVLRNLLANPFNCNCYLAWLGEWLRKKRIVTGNPRCQKPYFLKEIPIQDVAIQDFTCDDGKKAQPGLWSPDTLWWLFQCQRAHAAFIAEVMDSCSSYAFFGFVLWFYFALATGTYLLQLYSYI